MLLLLPFWLSSWKRTCFFLFAVHRTLLNSTDAMNLWLSILAIAYLLGSIPFGYLLVRFFRKEDIRAIGSGNIGATNVARSGAKGLGMLTLALDLLKGLTAVLIAKHFSPAAAMPSDLMVAAAVIAVLGHVFPVWLGFKGGKGVASALGVFIALAPWAALAALAVFLLLAFTTRYVSLASIVAAALIPVFAMLTTPNRSPVFLTGIWFIALLVIVKHHANIRRLYLGTESRFGSRSGGKKPSTAKANL
jgi:glycerol-3-phosphate acyltransferase PlsY